MQSRDRTRINYVMEYIGAEGVTSRTNRDYLSMRKKYVIFVSLLLPPRNFGLSHTITIIVFRMHPYYYFKQGQGTLVEGM